MREQRARAHLAAARDQHDDRDRRRRRPAAGRADLGNLVAQVTFTLPNSRTHEIEADRIGVEPRRARRLRPRAAVSVCRRWPRRATADRRSSSPPTPSPENRIKDLEVYAQR
ncbi:MAG: M48 family metalloprotease [Burkholderiales bacterium]